MNIINLLNKLTQIPTISDLELQGGFNFFVNDFISKFNLCLKTDDYRNIYFDIFNQQLSNQTIVIEAHYDEIPLSLCKNIPCKADDVCSSKKRFDHVFNNTNNIIRSIGLDNKVSIAIILDRLADIIQVAKTKSVNIRIIFSAGEELRKTNILSLIPKSTNYYIVMDAAYTKPTIYDFIESVNIPIQGGGTVFQTKGDGFIISSSELNRAVKVANDNSIKFQYEIPPKGLGYTNCAIFQKHGFNKGLVLNTPVRYQHEEISESLLDDIKHTSNLLIKFIEVIC